MSKFNIVKKINLHEALGEGHEQSYMTFKPMTFEDARKLQTLQSTEDFTPELPPAPAADASPQVKAEYEKTVKRLTDEAKAKENEASLASVDKAIAFMQGKFLEGNISGTAVDKEDFTNGNLPIDVINYCMAQLAGGKKPEGFTQG